VASDDGCARPGRLGRGVRATEVEPAVDAIWADHLRTSLWSDVPDEARQLLGDLAEHEVPTGVVSNAEGQVQASAERAGLARLVRVIVDSAVVRVAKPDPGIFEIGAKVIGVPLRETVYVGESESADVRGAHAAGADAIRFDGLVSNDSPSGAEAVAKKLEQNEAPMAGARRAKAGAAL
jgi:FMN phosphatase YigB (HAD superfamily)